MMEAMANEPAATKLVAEPPLVLSLFVELSAGDRREETEAEGVGDSFRDQQCDVCWSQCDCLSCYK